jgi:hypothetical protein
VKQYNNLNKIVRNVKFNLLPIFAVFVIYLIVYGKKNRFFIVKVVAYVGLVEEKISFTVIYANVVSL